VLALLLRRRISKVKLVNVFERMLRAGARIFQLHPGGILENSPTFQRWDSVFPGVPVPKGRLKGAFGQFSNPTTKKSRRRTRRRRTFIGCGLIIAATGLELTAATSAFAAPGSAPAQADIRRDATVIAVEKVMPSVVNIATETIVEYQDFYQNIFREFFGQSPFAPRRQREQSIGSGVIIDEEGYVLTNLHVVRRANRTQVKLWDGREYDATPMVATPFSDVALLKIQGKPGEKFTAIKFAADDELLLGETVLALGNPFGLGGTVTKGILSSKSRRPPTGNEPLNIQDWLQTDAAINPGNSGGPLINLRGELIGLSVAVFSQGQGIGFAIPVKQVSEALGQFFSPEVAHGLWFGARIKPGSAPLSVISVQPGSPADKAGLREGDKIVRIDGKTPDGLVQFTEMIGQAEDRKATMNIQGRREPLTVQLVRLDDVIQQRTGLNLTELNSQEAARVHLEAGKGLYVQSVEKNSPAARAGLQNGYMITAFDGQPIDNLVSVGTAIAAQKKGERVRLTVVAPRHVGGGYVEYRRGDVELTLR
jgi:serine protease Do